MADYDIIIANSTGEGRYGNCAPRDFAGYDKFGLLVGAEKQCAIRWHIRWNDKHFNDWHGQRIRYRNFSFATVNSADNKPGTSQSGSCGATADSDFFVR
jgi:hypothetical protein